MKTNTKRFVGLGLMLAMLVALLGAFSMTASAAAAEDISVTIDTGASITLKDTDGDGYYDIGTADELYAFAAAVNGGNSTINGELTANIVVNENVLNEDGTLNGDGSNFRVWIPIAYSHDYGGEVGFQDLYFKGTFDGNGKTISGLYLDNSEQGCVGLFGQINSGATVKNVGVIDSYFYCKQTVGGVVGYIGSNSTVMSSYNSGTIIGTDYIGGIVGWNSGGSITNCYNMGSVSGSKKYVGGVVGYNGGNSFVTNSYNTGDVRGITCVGGVVGKLTLCDGTVIQGDWVDGAKKYEYTDEDYENAGGDERFVETDAFYGAAFENTSYRHHL